MTAQERSRLQKMRHSTTDSSNCKESILQYASKRTKLNKNEKAAKNKQRKTNTKRRQHGKAVQVKIPLFKEPGMCFRKRPRGRKDANKRYGTVDLVCGSVYSARLNKSPEDLAPKKGLVAGGMW